ncbi:MAG: iron ABC transporter permease, partial [Clostridia bacterium]
MKRMELRKERFNFWTVVTAIILAFAALFIVYPFLRLFYQSFFPKGGPFSLSNYAKFFQKKYYLSALKNSLSVCLWSTALGVVIGIPMAYIHTRFNIWGKRLW